MRSKTTVVLKLNIWICGDSIKIIGSFHPEENSSSIGGDKCYKLRHLLNAFNNSSKHSLFVPTDLEFDEGGVGCRSRFSL